MAFREPPKKEEKGKGMLMKEALDARVTELSTSLQEMMADGETSGQESSANETPLTTRRTDPSRSAPTDGLCRRESYCLLVRVVKDAVGLSEWDVRLPAHAGSRNDYIAVDICESRIGCLAGTYKVQLLSDTEFLLRKRPTSGPEMNWQDANTIIRLISGLFLWCGVLVSLAAGHRSKKETKYDLDATFAYRHTRAQERTVLSKFRKDSKKSVISPKEPQPRGRGMTRRADKFLAKKMAGGQNRNGPPSILLQEVQTDIIQQRKIGILTMTPRRKHKRWSLMWSICSNPVTLTIVPSGRAMPLSIVNAAQQKIGTGRELDKDLRPRIPTGL